MKLQITVYSRAKIEHVHNQEQKELYPHVNLKLILLLVYNLIAKTQFRPGTEKSIQNSIYDKFAPIQLPKGTPNHHQNTNYLCGSQNRKCGSGTTESR